MDRILNVENLQVSFHTYAGEVRAVRGVSFELGRGETLAFVGESGCGKTATAKAIMRLWKPPFVEIKSDSVVEYNGEDVMKMDKKRLQSLRGNDISMIFQDPMTSLNPTMTVGKQIMEGLQLHRGLNKAQAREEAINMLRMVKIPVPEKNVDSYPHQLSGGMRQRVMIAMALACKPKILIADEPTTALDVTIQAQILKLMNELKEENGTAVLFITHDLGVINQMADNVAVMYCGQVVEMAPRRTIFHNNVYSHPYTEGLMLSIPRLDTPEGTRLEAIPGAVPHPLDLPKGCKFAPRCKYCTKRCQEEEPELVNVSEEQQVRCFYPKKEERHG